MPVLVNRRAVRARVGARCGVLLQCATCVIGLISQFAQSCRKFIPSVGLSSRCIPQLLRSYFPLCHKKPSLSTSKVAGFYEFQAGWALLLPCWQKAPVSSTADGKTRLTLRCRNAPRATPPLRHSLTSGRRGKKGMTTPCSGSRTCFPYICLYGKEWGNN